MNEIQIFSNPQFGEIRIIADENNEPLFCLTDLCKVLDLTPSKVAQRLTGDVLSKYPLETNGGIQQANFVNEDGLYDAILDSRKPEAKTFRKWVTSEVLPSIRRHGAYATPQTIENMLADPDNAIKVFQTLKEERQLRLEAEKKVDKLKPLADFAKTAFSSDTLISISQAAKILKLPFGRNTLFKKLRESGIFFTNKNEPKQRYVDAGYFRLSEGNPIETSNGLMIPVTVYCTQKGLAYINLKFGNGQTEVPQTAKIS